MEKRSGIEARIRKIVADYKGYPFTPEMDAAIETFLDLALEFRNLEELILLAVLIPHITLGWEISLYLVENGSEAVLAASSRSDLMQRLAEGEKVAIECSPFPRQEEDDYLAPLSLGPIQWSSDIQAPNSAIGMISVRTKGDGLDENDLFFLQKYASLIGLSVSQRHLANRNEQHLRFIKQLVTDIGHNVIVPNIIFKAYLRRLSGKIERLRVIQKELQAAAADDPQNLAGIVLELSAEMNDANEGLSEEFDHIQKHYINTSLFLETLLRQAHFEEGRYVLRKKTCNFRRDIIDPQMERFEIRLRERRIEVDLSMGGVPDRAIEAIVDMGLISQVFANFLSNAIKYTRTVWWNGVQRKFIAYGLEIVPGAFGPTGDGVKLNLFSSGRPLDSHESRHLFEEGFRGSNIENEHGTGHGLFFVREVVELHGGRAGHESTLMGNNFYILLPRQLPRFLVHLTVLLCQYRLIVIFKE